MAGSVTLNHVPVLLGAVAAAGFAHGASAPVLNDPTRPPAVLSRPEAESAVPGAPILQSVIIAPGRTAAVISGETVPLGGQYREARLVRITETGVVLQSSSGIVTLTLFPGVELRRSAADRAAPARDGGKRVPHGER